MSDNNIDMQINIGTTYDRSGVERVNEDIKKIKGAFSDVVSPAQVMPWTVGEVKQKQDANNRELPDKRHEEEDGNYERRVTKAAEMGAAGATRQQIIVETGIDPIWKELERARAEQEKVNYVLVEEYKREMEHYFTVAREDLERTKISGEIGKEDYEYGKRKIALEEKLYRVKLAEVEAEMKLAEAKYDSLQKQVKAEQTYEEKDEKAARVAREKEITAERELEYARKRVKREEERHAEAEVSAVALRDAKKKAREEKESQEKAKAVADKREQGNEKKKESKREEEKHLQGMANVDLKHRLKKAKKNAKIARKAGDEEGAEAAEAEAAVYRAEMQRRKSLEKVKKMRDKVERKLGADKEAEKQARSKQAKVQKVRLTGVQLMDDVDLRRNYTKAKRRYRDARKRRSSVGMQAARAEVLEYGAELNRRRDRRVPRRRKRMTVVRETRPTAIAGKEKEIITEAMGYVKRMEKGEKETGVSIERLLKLWDEAQKTRSKRDDQLIAGIMQLVQAENIQGTKVEKALEKLNKQTAALGRRMFD